MSKPVVCRDDGINGVVSAANRKGPAMTTPDLIRKISEGDQDAFSVLYDSQFNFLVRRMMYYLNSKDDAFDVVQEIFSEIWENRKKLNPDIDINPYLFTMVKNRLSDLLRRQNLSNNYQINQMLAENEFSETPYDVLNFNEYLIKTKEVIDSLTDQQRVVYELRNYEGLSCEQISKKLNIKVNTVYAHIRDAKKILNKIKNSVFCFFL